MLLRLMGHGRVRHAFIWNWISANLGMAVSMLVIVKRIGGNRLNMRKFQYCGFCHKVGHSEVKCLIKYPQLKNPLKPDNEGSLNPNLNMVPFSNPNSVLGNNPRNLAAIENIKKISA
ncbi:hypothetical protein ACH5RR_026044 [Cinchona calisaya]|uniref:Uncharacterized protein n=1 Tax=Cinchona calisaya TaxID=153742 RepID=A0ABD2Z1D9_9GENT